MRSSYSSHSPNHARRITQDHPKYPGGHNGGHHVIQHGADPALYILIHQAHREGLPDVEDTEQEKGEEIVPPEMGGNAGSQKNPDDLINHDRLMVFRSGAPNHNGG